MLILLLTLAAVPATRPASPPATRPAMSRPASQPASRPVTTRPVTLDPAVASEAIKEGRVIEGMVIGQMMQAMKKWPRPTLRREGAVIVYTFTQTNADRIERNAKLQAEAHLAQRRAAPLRMLTEPPQNIEVPSPTIEKVLVRVERGKVVAVDYDDGARPPE